MDENSLSHTRWKCQYHIVFIPKYRRKVLYGKVKADVHGLYELRGLHAVHALHDKSGKNHSKSNPGVADPKSIQTNSTHDAGPTVYSCGIRGMRAASVRDLHKEKRARHI
jgi:putative transposase